MGDDHGDGDFLVGKEPVPETSPVEAETLDPTGNAGWAVGSGSSVMKSVKTGSLSSWISTFSGEARLPAIVLSSRCSSSLVSGPSVS